jgi:hypothetical protein
MLKEKIHFSKCPHCNEQPCPGENLGNIGRAASTQVVYVENGKPVGGDLVDFIKEHHCDKCPKNKGQKYFTNQ